MQCEDFVHWLDSMPLNLRLEFTTDTAQANASLEFVAGVTKATCEKLEKLDMVTYVDKMFLNS